MQKTCQHLLWPKCRCSKEKVPAPVATLETGAGIPTSAGATQTVATDLPDVNEDLPVESGRGVVYFLIEEGGERIKIGKTLNIDKRMRDLGHLSPRPLVLVALIEGYTAVERWFHLQFAAERVHGEWFNYSERLRKVVERIKAGETSAALCRHALIKDGFPAPPEVDEPSEEDEIENRREMMRVFAEKLRQITKRKCKESFYEFFRQAWPELEAGTPLEWQATDRDDPLGLNDNPNLKDTGWHIRALCDHMQWLYEGWQAVRAGRKPPPGWRKDLVVNMAPVSLKSKIVMVAFPAWVWLNAPEASFGCLSGNPGNVKRDSDACRDLVRSDWYRETFDVYWKIREEADATKLWRTTAKGERVSIGFATAKVGLHCDFILLDDPDNPDKVYSDADRAKTEAQWKALTTRVKNESATVRVVLQQRLHVDDLSAKLIKVGWTVLRVPALFDPSNRCVTPMIDARTGKPWEDPRSEPGENVMPTRLTASVLADKLRDLGPFMFEAQFNQAPDSLEGGYFKKADLRFFRFEGDSLPEGDRPAGCRPRSEMPARVIGRDRFGRPKFDQIILSVDPSGGSTEPTASRVGLLAIGILGKDKFIIGDRSKRRDWPTMRDDVKQMAKDFWCTTVLVEKKALGEAVIKQLQEAGVSGVVAWDPGTERDKQSRIVTACQPAIAAGDIHVLDGAYWLDRSCGDGDDPGFVPEFFGTPKSPHNDRADALAQLLDWLDENGAATMGVTSQQWGQVLGSL